MENRRIFVQNSFTTRIDYNIWAKKSANVNDTSSDHQRNVKKRFQNQVSLNIVMVSIEMRRCENAAFETILEKCNGKCLFSMIVLSTLLAHFECWLHFPGMYCVLGIKLGCPIHFLPLKCLWVTFFLWFKFSRTHELWSCSFYIKLKAMMIKHEFLFLNVRWFPFPLSQVEEVFHCDEIYFLLLFFLVYKSRQSCYSKYISAWAPW